ncbi:hypothetical protein N0V84_012256 [Fusarium piperis]|uniref:Uncharacterized protein n=1 Tax=Fusarium piperis TaxID=1435070 RepID=A0A9W8TBU4_9HYPO|nr:hypothetical protein N0V84_012256 [Fusarium piperis]
MDSPPQDIQDIQDIPSKTIPQDTRILASPPFFKSPMTNDGAVKDEMLEKVNSLRPVHETTFLTLTSLLKYESYHPAWDMFCSNDLSGHRGKPIVLARLPHVSITPASATPTMTGTQPQP